MWSLRLFGGVSKVRAVRGCCFQAVRLHVQTTHPRTRPTRMHSLLVATTAGVSTMEALATHTYSSGFACYVRVQLGSDMVCGVCSVVCSVCSRPTLLVSEPSARFHSVCIARARGHTCCAPTRCMRRCACAIDCRGNRPCKHFLAPLRAYSYMGKHFLAPLRAYSYMGKHRTSLPAAPVAAHITAHLAAWPCAPSSPAVVPANTASSTHAARDGQCPHQPGWSSHPYNVRHDTNLLRQWRCVQMSVVLSLSLARTLPLSLQ